MVGVEECGIGGVVHKSVLVLVHAHVHVRVRVRARVQVDGPGWVDGLGAFDGRECVIDAFVGLVVLAERVELHELELELDENDDYTGVAVAAVERFP